MPHGCGTNTLPSLSTIAATTAATRRPAKNLHRLGASLWTLTYINRELGRRVGEIEESLWRDGKQIRNEM